ncbi:MAG: S-formylglutathione hydrolase [Parvularculaceae bacterium]|nr:S-formylglutathione hydrolase [Parvularculaceae bacterium]
MKAQQTITTHGGTLTVYEHESRVTGTVMQFAAFIPPQAEKGPVPCLWYLSGLTCTWANVIEKGGILAAAAKHGIAVIAPDTSPRGDDVANDDGYDLGQGAGFYLTATQDPWAPHFKMDQYIMDELQAMVRDTLPIDPERQGITGHSMGGHGAMTLHLKHPNLYKTCSAFAPISAPSHCPWGEKAFTVYLRTDKAQWSAYDASALVTTQPSKAHILIDQGASDQFLAEQLKHDVFEAAAKDSGQAYTLKYHEGYDHSYYFVSTFMDDHVRHHAESL